MKNQRGDDLFGMAFRDYLEGHQDVVLTIHTDIADPDELPVEYFFRESDQLPHLEQVALEHCRGRVLDVGAGAGSHSLILQQRGLEVVSLDVSPGGVEVMKQRGLQQVVCQDFLRYSQAGFDCLLFLMNGSGLAGTLPGLKVMLQHAWQLLNPGGVVILDSTDIIYMFEDEQGYLIPMNEKYYGEVMYQVEYKGLRSLPFSWLFVDYDNLADLATACGFHISMAARGDNHNFLALMTKPQSK